jgi:transcriptional regulator with XRE-family HTH domain
MVAGRGHAPVPARILSERLRELREREFGPLTQKQLARALGGSDPLSAATVSLWERPGSDRLPPPERLAAYARLFCTHRSFSSGAPRLLPDEELTERERAREAELYEELLDLRARAQSAGPVIDSPEQISVEQHGSLSRFPDETVSALDALLPGYVRPHEMKAYLDQFVVGQEPAKTELSALLSMHLLFAREPGRTFQTPNALLVGPTGVGKTHSIRTAADYLRLPIVNADATKLLPSGAYSESGEHIEVLLGELLDAAQAIVNKIEESARGEVARILRSEYGYGGRSGFE